MISWFSRAQKVAVAATPESRYVAPAEVANSLCFQQQVKAFIIPLIDCDIVINGDNDGAIDWSRIGSTAIVRGTSKASTT